MKLQVDLGDESLQRQHEILNAHLVEAKIYELQDLKQKSHVAWLTQGDQNNKFFSQMT